MLPQPPLVAIAAEENNVAGDENHPGNTALLLPSRLAKKYQAPKVSLPDQNPQKQVPLAAPLTAGPSVAVQAKHSLNSFTTRSVMKQQQTAKVASATAITTPGIVKQQNAANASSAAVGKKRARPEVSHEESRKRARTDAPNPKPKRLALDSSAAISKVRRQMEEQAMKYEEGIVRICII
jgi:hypothetical protein